MATFAQTHFTEKVGNGPHGINQIGCLLDSFSNGLQVMNGHGPNPAELNSYFKEHNVYKPDPADGAGVRDNLYWEAITTYDRSITKASTGKGWPTSSNSIVEFHYKHNGQDVTHFCWVHNAAKHQIVDSWDGQIKSPAQYEFLYGQPAKYATYRKPVVKVVKPAAPPVTVHPASHPTPPAAKPEVHVNAVVPAPKPPAPPEAPKPPEPHRQTNIEYTKLQTPLHLVVNKNPTHLWRLDFPNDTVAVSEETLEVGTPFIAYGKGQRTDHDRPCYYMNEHDFGEADKTGIPLNNFGINVVDLEYPKTTETKPQAPIEPAVPNPSWQTSYVAGLSNVEYFAKEDFVIHDIAGVGPDVKIPAGKSCWVAGTFADGAKYYRLTNDQTSAPKSWYGAPVTLLSRAKPMTDTEIDYELNNLQNEPEPSKVHKAAIATTASTQGFLSRLIYKVFRRK